MDKETKKKAVRKPAVKKAVALPLEVKEIASETVVEAVNEAEGEKPGDNKKKTEYIYAVGRRKTAVAQVRLYKKGEGEIIVNGKSLDEYFPAEQGEDVRLPLRLAGQTDKLKITVKVVGGGKNGQAEAVRHGLARTLIQLNPNFRKPLKKAGFLTRDSRRKERKKPGLKGARRAPQFSKR